MKPQPPGLTVTTATKFNLLLEVAVLTHTKQKVAIRVAASLVLALAILLTFSFAGCELTPLVGGNKEPSTTNPQQTLGHEDPPAPQPQIPAFLNPLTGLGTTEALAGMRPISVCLGNTSAEDTPQFGISHADVLIEVPVEGGISRLMMITTDYRALDKIGSVRSTRNSLARLADSFDAVQMYAGTCDEGTSVLLPYDTLDYLTQNLPNIYYRDSERKAPYNLMTSGSLAASGIAAFNYRTTLAEDFALPYAFAAYGDTVLPKDDTALAVRIAYSYVNTVTFTYDTESHTYGRTQFGTVQKDAAGQALAFTNLFVLNSDTITYENANGSTLELAMENGGTGIWCSEGKREEIRWSMSQDGQFTFTDKDGRPLEVNRGVSYIGFVKVSQTGAVSVQ